MCDHCGCRDQGAIGQLMRQHDLILRLAQQVRRALAVNDEITGRAAFSDLHAILTPHNAWEDRGLFTRMTEQGKYADQVRELEAEHVHLHAAIRQADLTPLGWGKAITVILDQIDEHIRKENLELFPAAHSVLGAEDWEAVEEAAPTGCACGGRCGSD